MIPAQFDVEGKLELGVEVGGVVHREFVIGPISVAGAMAADAETDVRPEGVDPDAWRGLCRTARRVRRLGTLPSGWLTGRVLLEMAEVDVNVLISGSQEVEAAIASFRAGGQVAPQGPRDRGEGDALVRGVVDGNA